MVVGQAGISGVVAVVVLGQAGLSGGIFVIVVVAGVFRRSLFVQFFISLFVNS